MYWARRMYSPGFFTYARLYGLPGHRKARGRIHDSGPGAVVCGADRTLGDGLDSHHQLPANHRETEKPGGPAITARVPGSEGESLVCGRNRSLPKRCKEHPSLDRGPWLRKNRSNSLPAFAAKSAKTKKAATEQQ